MSRSTRFAALVSVLLLAGLWSVSAAMGATETTFSGRAVALQGNVLGIQIPCLTPGPADCRGLVDTGDVAATGGELEANLVCYPGGTNCFVTSPIGDPTGGTLRAQALHASVVASGNKSRAETSLADFQLVNVAGNTIGASFLSAEAEAKCTGGTASVTGSAQIAELVINGQTITVGGAVNQRVALALLGSYVIVNEQVGSASADRGDITVSALHIVVPGVADVVVAQAHADIVCATSPPRCNGPEKVTGGGWVPRGGSRGTFAVAGKQLSDWGHFLFVDHTTGDKLQATTLSAAGLSYDSDGFAVLTGAAKLNGSGDHPFTVKVKDNGEPGKSDQIQLISVISHPLSFLAGGNIQFHKPCK
jgi:hypothetical protein